jgi:vacuolar-type H+-ATPase subunit F/Vma7
MFNKLVQRGDVGLIIINQPVADQIRPVIAAYTAAVPMVLEIPAAGGGSGAFNLKKDPVSPALH